VKALNLAASNWQDKALDGLDAPHNDHLYEIAEAT
jgi:hypothetical protein